jgi:sugar lactone lactonase YvrE
MYKTALSFITLAVAYLLFWPVAIAPVSWNAPVNTGYVDAFEQNTILEQIEMFEMKGTHGPEGLAFLNGEIYATTREGWIVRHNPINGKTKNWVHTKGSPLGIAFDQNNNLLVADAYLGLLAITPNGRITTLTNRVDGSGEGYSKTSHSQIDSLQINSPQINYADDVDIAADGKIYFSDASTKFAAKTNGGTYQASLLDTLEHGGHGRLLVYNPEDKTTKILMSGLNFANGVAVAADSSFVLVIETGSYRIHKYWLQGEKTGQSEIVIDNLPGFPDNIVRGHEGRFWVGLVAPRNKLLDALSNYPFVRKIIQRLPAHMRPEAEHYAHVFAIDKQGKVLLSLQDPRGNYHTTTGVLETDNWLYISSLHAENLGRISKANAGLK